MTRDQALSMLAAVKEAQQQQPLTGQSERVSLERLVNAVERAPSALDHELERLVREASEGVTVTYHSPSAPVNKTLGRWHKYPWER